MVETIFATETGQITLVFLLVFVVVFGILQKAKIFGDGKKRIDALVALAMGLIVISVGYAVDIISNLIPFLAVAVVIILVFMILVGSVYPESKFELPKWAIGVVAAVSLIAVVVAVLYFSGAWDTIYDFFTGENSSQIVVNIITIIVVIGGIIAVLYGGKPK